MQPKRTLKFLAGKIIQKTSTAILLSISDENSVEVQSDITGYHKVAVLNTVRM